MHSPGLRRVAHEAPQGVGKGLPASPAPFSAVFEFTERRGSFVYIVRESHLMRSTIEVEDFDFQGLRDACAHPARAQHPDRVQPSREAAPGSRQPMGPRARAARPQSTGAGARRRLGAPSRTTRRRAARPPAARRASKPKKRRNMSPYMATAARSPPGWARGSNSPTSV